jgi:hypothetical protein
VRRRIAANRHNDALSLMAQLESRDRSLEHKADDYERARRTLDADSSAVIETSSARVGTVSSGCIERPRRSCDTRDPGRPRAELRT